MPIKLPFLPRRREFPPDLWTKCPRCGEMLYNKQLERNLRVCSKCGHHFRLRADVRLRLLLDADSFEEHDAGLEATDALAFVDQKPYPDRLAAARIATGLRDAAVWGTGRIDGQPVAICVMDFAFIGGSMGSVVGEKVTRAAEHALLDRMPLVVVSASGGARMQEGTLALMQLAKTCAAIGMLADAGVPFVSVLTDPTSGGVFASYAALGDVNIAEPDAYIGFAGTRVAAGTIAAELPPGFQRSEFLLEHGFLDRIVSRDRLRDELAKILCYLREGSPCASAPVQGQPGSAADAHEPGFRPFGLRLPAIPGIEPARAGRVLPVVAPDGMPASSAPLGIAPPAATATTSPALPGQPLAPLPAAAPSGNGSTPHPAALEPQVADEATTQRVWARVMAARNLRRPHTLDLVRAMATDVLELHGDRLFGDDPAIVAGLARITGHAFVFVGHQRGSETEENIRRNFGMAHPEGYRKAMRAFELAERFRLPIVTFVDTGGAYPGAASEERGVAEAIARSIMLMTGLRTPIVSIITGEGGSGGALGIAVGDTVLALENAIYSVISPEGCATIIYRDAGAAQKAAVALRLTADDQLRLGVVDEVVPEPAGGAQEDPIALAATLSARISAHLASLRELTPEELVARRRARYRSMGAFVTVEREVPPAQRRPDLAGRLRDLIEAGRATLGVPETPAARGGADRRGSERPDLEPDDVGAPLREEL